MLKTSNMDSFDLCFLNLRLADFLGERDSKREIFLPCFKDIPKEELFKKLPAAITAFKTTVSLFLDKYGREH